MKRAYLSVCFALLLSSACGDDDVDSEAPPDEEQPPPADDLDGGAKARDGSIDAALSKPDGSIAQRPDAGDAGARADASAVSDGATLDGGSRDGGTGDSGAVAARPDAAVSLDNCADGFPRGSAKATRRLVLEAKPTIEGVAVCPNGEVFVTAASASEVWRVPLDGAAKEVWAKQPEGMYAGLTCDSKGRLFVADFGASAKGTVVMVNEKNKLTSLANPKDDLSTGYNGILAVKDVGVYASDTTAGRVILQRETAPGVFTASVAVSDVQGANGLALGPNGRLYLAVSNFLGGENQVLSWSVSPEGALRDRKVEWKGSNVVDGVALDEKGEIYIAFYSEGKVVRASNGSTVATATNPASFDFRGGTLFYSDYDVVGSQLENALDTVLTTGHLYAIDLGVCGVR